jgi:hypothetical protein
MATTESSAAAHPSTPKAERIRRAQARAYEEALARYTHELMDDEERQILCDRIKRLQRTLVS